MSTSIIIVNYKSEKLLSKCLFSIEKYLKNVASFEVIIVNNDNKKITLDKSFSFKIKIIQNKKNSGFGAANNLGVKEAKGDNLFLLNPDTILQDSSVQELFSFLNKNHHLGVVAPKIIQSKRQSPQPFTCGKKTSLWGILFRNTILKPWNSKSPILVDWVSGTALLVRKSIFEKVGGFDENFFMYFEDQDFCIRVKELGYDIAFFPESSIVHFDGKSWPNTKNQKKSFYKAQDYFFKKHQSPYQGFLLKVLKKIAI